MKRLILPALLLSVMGVWGAVPSPPQNSTPYYQVATVGVNQSGFLYVVFKEAGLPAGDPVQYTFVADGRATYSCLPNGYSVPKNKKDFPEPKEIVEQGFMQSSETLYVPNGGKIVDGVAVAPPEPTQANVTACANSGGTFHLVQVSYSSVSLSDDHGGVATLSGNCLGASGCTEVLPGK